MWAGIQGLADEAYYFEAVRDVKKDAGKGSILTETFTPNEPFYSAVKGLKA